MVADPHHFNADPEWDLAFQFLAVPDPAFYCNADPDPHPAPRQGDGNLRSLFYTPYRTLF
jgi:hypothetical protein